MPRHPALSRWRRAAIVEKTIGLRGPTTEIKARTKPSLIDLGVAIAAALAAIRRNIADTLPGVAIAVALVPPLCVSGLSFSIGAWSMGLGAALLFAVNLVAIILSAAVVFVLGGYGSLRHAWLGLMIILSI